MDSLREGASARLRFLLIEDNDDDVVLIEEFLSDAEIDASCTVVKTEAQLEEALERNWDFVLSDHKLPGFSSAEALRLVQSRHGDTPFIIVSGAIDEDDAIEAMRLGCRDYVFKNQLTRLGVVVNRELGQNRAFNVDKVTGLPNRGGFREALECALFQTSVAGRVGLLVVDLDRFHVVNEALGQRQADQLLRRVGERLSSLSGMEGRVARLGGNEFAVLVTERDSQEQVINFTERVRGLFDAPFDLAGHELKVAASIGVSIYPDDAQDPWDLLGNAAMAMQDVKRDGGNGVGFFTAELNNRALEMLTLEASLYSALERKEFELYYQPQVSLFDNRIVSVEALLRWNSPERGIVSPADFVPLSEANGLIVEIGRWVLHEAARQLVEWLSQGQRIFRVAVNISAVQFQKSDIVEDIARALAETGLPGHYLEIEITEGALIKDVEKTIGTLHRIKDMGVRIAIDDFGTGYSSLSYLRRFPIDTLKVDRSFVKDVCETDGSAELTRSIIGLGHSLNLSSVAEGIETREQHEFLRGCGCQYAQGFLFAQPLPPRELIRALERDHQAAQASRESMPTAVDPGSKSNRSLEKREISGDDDIHELYEWLLSQEGSRRHATTLLLDFSGIDEISSHACVQLLLIRDVCGASDSDLRLLNCSRGVREKMKTLKFDRMFSVL